LFCDVLSTPTGLPARRATSNNASAALREMGAPCSARLAGFFGESALRTSPIANVRLGGRSAQRTLQGCERWVPHAPRGWPASSGSPPSGPVRSRASVSGAVCTADPTRLGFALRRVTGLAPCALRSARRFGFAVRKRGFRDLGLASRSLLGYTGQSAWGAVDSTGCGLRRISGPVGPDRRVDPAAEAPGNGQPKAGIGPGTRLPSSRSAR
jgi:hypothetical protein